MVIILSNNFSTFDNPYAVIAQGTYPRSPIQFPYDYLDPKQQQNLNAGQSISFDFSKDVPYKNKTIPGGKYYSPNPSKTEHPDWPKDGVVYLQPAPKGRMSDPLTGFNAYFLTDTPTLSSQTTNTYFAVRGSDGEPKLKDPSNWNDWFLNNAVFALGDSPVLQSIDATIAMKAKFDELRQNAPQAKMNFTAHSLGTFVTAQGLAGLDSKYWEQIGNVVLFNGPDPTKSLRKQGLNNDQIKQLGSHVTYYLNPLDFVSMLNREVPKEQQFGTVHFIVPLDITDSLVGDGSAHMFGQFQFDSKGNPKIATDNYHPYLLKAGNKLAKLLAEAKKLDFHAINESPKLLKKYQEIITWARNEAIKWNKQAIPDYQSKIRGASGDEKVSLRVELLQSVAQLTVLEMGDKLKVVEDAVKQSKEETQSLATVAEYQARMAGQNLHYSEIDRMLAGYTFNDIWSAGKEEEVKQSLKTYRDKVHEVVEKLMLSARNVKDIDAEGARGFQVEAGK